MLSTDAVWDRRQTTDDIVSDSTYNFTIGMVLMWGLSQARSVRFLLAPS